MKAVMDFVGSSSWVSEKSSEGCGGSLGVVLPFWDSEFRQKVDGIVT